jgi:CRP-like cAMP-binding protein
MAQNTVYTYYKEFNAGDIVFREGDKSDCMYEVQKGKIDLYIAYGTPEQKKIAEVGPERFLGEMGMVEGLCRSATAVAATDYTVLAQITWDVFGMYFKKKPAKVVQIMQQMGDRLRITTKAAMDLKNTVNEAIDIMEGEKTDSEAMWKLKNGLRSMNATLENNK